MRLLKFVPAGLMLLALYLAPVRACAQEDEPDQAPKGALMTVGDPRHPEGLGAELLEAYAKGIRRFSVRSGTYLFGPSGLSPGHAAIELSGWKRVTILGHNVTFISSDPNPEHAVIRLNGCSKVELDEFTLTQSTPPAFQGRVQSVSIDSAGRTVCVCDPDPGYPRPSAKPALVAVVDAKSRRLKQTCLIQTNALIFSSSGNGLLFVFPGPVSVTTGDLLVCRGADAAARVRLTDCHECALAGMTFVRNGSQAVIEEAGGGNAYYACHWLPDARAERLQDKPVVSDTGVGIRSAGCYPGPDLENAEFDGVELGPCVEVYGPLLKVEASSAPDQITVGQNGGRLEKGQPIRLSAKGYIENAFVKSIAAEADRRVSVTLDRAVNPPVGAYVSNPFWNGAGFKVLNSHLSGCCAAAIVAESDGALIQGNLMTLCAGPVVLAGPDHAAHQADYSQDLSIRANQISHNGFGLQLPAILVRGDGAYGNRDVTVENNEFEADFFGDVVLEWSKDSTVGDNIFTGFTSLPPGIPPPHPIELHDSNGIKVSHNAYHSVNNFSKPLVLAGKDVLGLKTNESN